MLVYWKYAGEIQEVTFPGRIYNEESKFPDRIAEIPGWLRIRGIDGSVQGTGGYILPEVDQRFPRSYDPDGSHDFYDCLGITWFCDDSRVTLPVHVMGYENKSHRVDFLLGLVCSCTLDSLDIYAFRKKVVKDFERKKISCVQCPFVKSVAFEIGYAVSRFSRKLHEML
jgi:hypothetical protein